MEAPGETEVENEDADSNCGDLCFMDKGLRSISELSLDSALHAINLHCNNISKITSIDHIWNLQHLDLSSNQISQIEGLNTLTKLCTLNLSCNLITRIEGLEALSNLTRLNLSYNHINDLSGVYLAEMKRCLIKDLYVNGKTIIFLFKIIMFIWLFIISKIRKHPYVYHL
uniref:Leucine rich repeat and coiled-coil centrosomal protein 1 n=1 Tax=Ovis aries TaxID=9940 RepID=A0AC11CTM0_SHEEP